MDLETSVRYSKHATFSLANSGQLRSLKCLSSGLAIPIEHGKRLGYYGHLTMLTSSKDTSRLPIEAVTTQCLNYVKGVNL